ncbi:glutamine-hydrolyzing carbamoyl-phosphate synthase small subunit [Spiribacter sp. 370]|uniref:Carbamoyl phosphate synthase small chain n=2 Tax=Spiribacter pallidus TaxID=1987936 RepID=A0ABV3TBJ7_9GAMM
MSDRAILALEDGSVFRGSAMGASGETVGEVCFNTAMTGYQEICTDPSYHGQIVTLTYPHIGNTGTNPLDEEADGPQLAGLVIRDAPMRYSNWRASQSLPAYLAEHGIVAISDIDTRRLTRLLRETGAQNGCIISGASASAEAAVERARAHPSLTGRDLVQAVTTDTAYEWRRGTWSLAHDEQEAPVEAEATLRWHVVAMDFGIKRNILRMLVDAGCRVTVVPARTGVDEIMALGPDGVFLSNGPGDPEPLDYAIDTTRRLLETGVPVFGICLGHQLLGLAAGARSEKMKFGHHGANHPVLDRDSGRVMISSQNHGFAIEAASLPENVRVMNESLFDGSLQGIHLTDAPAFSFQGHPEASPGPHDVAPFFAHFVELMAARHAA